MNLAYKNTALIEELGCVFFHDYFIRIDCPEEKKKWWYLVFFQFKGKELFASCVAI